MLNLEVGDPELLDAIKKLSQIEGGSIYKRLTDSWEALLACEDRSSFTAAKQLFIDELLLFEQSDPILLHGLTFLVSGGSRGEEASRGADEA